MENYITEALLGAITALVLILLRNQIRKLRETVAAITGCRDHWKISFEHERANVIRLRLALYPYHEQRMCWLDDCPCDDCQLVRRHAAMAKLGNTPL